MDDADYHRRRADQHRALLERCDARYAFIHRRMIELHEERAAGTRSAADGLTGIHPRPGT